MAEIDLTWDASTDDVAVAGYHISRGGVRVATVPADVLAYSDTGLADTTTYSYTVSAFDAAGNTSAESASASATTTTGGSGGVGAPPSSYTPNKVYTGSGSFDAFLAGLVAGDVASIAAGVTPTISAAITHGGTAAQPIVVTSDDWASPATILGRLDMRGAAGWWVFDFLNLNDSATAFGAGHAQSWVCGGHDNIFQRLDLTNSNTKIGFEFIDDSTFGVARNNTISRCRIHDIGRLPYGYTNNDHGVYDIGYGLHIVDTLIENCSDRGIQMRGSKGALAEYVTVQHCGEGIIFGDLGAVNSKITKSILLNNQKPGRYLIESYDPDGTNSGNTVDDNYAWNTSGAAVQAPSLSGVTVTSLHHADPTGVSGYGPRVTPGLH